jgi:hypothetical protein
MAATPSIPGGTVMPLNGLSCYFAEKQINRAFLNSHSSESEEYSLLVAIFSGLFQTLSFYPEDGGYTFLRNTTKLYGALYHSTIFFYKAYSCIFVKDM